MGVAFGIFLGLGGSLCINTGNNLQSLGMHQEDLKGDDEDEVPNLCENKTWVLGTVIFVTGALLNFASYGFAPQSTLASLESIQFVSNLFFGWWLLGKEITQKMIFGTALTVGGTVLAVVFSSKEAAEIEDVSDLVHLWNNDLWISYIVLLAALALILHLGYKRLQQIEKQKHLENLMAERELTKDHENEMAVIYAVFSALFGTLSVVFAKLLAKLVELQAEGINIFAEWYTYVSVVSWLILMVFWLYRLNDALSLYNPLFIIPLLQANFIFFAIVSGGIYFQEFNYMKSLNWIGFICGIIGMFVGIALLVPAKSPETITPSNAEYGMELKDVAIVSENTDVSEGCCRGGVAKLLMTGPARMYEREFCEKAQRERYKKMANEIQSRKRMTGDEAELVKQLYKNVLVADKMIDHEKRLTDIMSNKEIDEEGGKMAKELMETWVESKEDFRQNDTKINNMVRIMSGD